MSWYVALVVTVAIVGWVSILAGPVWRLVTRMSDRLTDLWGRQSRLALKNQIVKSAGKVNGSSSRL